MKSQKMVAMDIIANPFNEFSNWRVYEDVLHVFVNKGDNLDLNGCNARVLCAHALLVPHDDIDETSVGVSTCPILVSGEANECGLSKMVVCVDVSNNVIWVSVKTIILLFLRPMMFMVIACTYYDSMFPMPLVEPSMCTEKPCESA